MVARGRRRLRLTLQPAYVGSASGGGRSAAYFLARTPGINKGTGGCQSLLVRLRLPAESADSAFGVFGGRSRVGRFVVAAVELEAPRFHEHCVPVRAWPRQFLPPFKHPHGDVVQRASGRPPLPEWYCARPSFPRKSDPRESLHGGEAADRVLIPDRSEPLADVRPREVEQVPPGVPRAVDGEAEYGSNPGRMSCSQERVELSLLPAGPFEPSPDVLPVGVEHDLEPGVLLERLPEILLRLFQLIQVLVREDELDGQGPGLLEKDREVRAHDLLRSSITHTTFTAGFGPTYLAAARRL